MSNKKLTDLTAATSLASTDYIYVVQGSASRKATISQITSAVGSGAATLSNVAGVAATRAELATKSTSIPVVYLKEAGMEGIFVYETGNHSAQVTIDTVKGIYVPNSLDPSGTSGCWVHKFSDRTNVKWFGATGNGTTDDSPAFTIAIALLGSLANTGYGYGYAGTSTLFIPKGTYNLNTTTLDFTFGMTLEGESVGFLGPGGTVLKWAAGTTGIRTQMNNTTGATGVLGTPISSFGMIKFKNFTLYGAYTSTEAEAHGIHMRVQAHVEDVGIFNFQGDGVRITATSGGGVGIEGNANSWFCKRVFTQGCRNGFYTDGADANSGYAIMCGATSNRQWGYWDSSFLGNNWDGCQTIDNGLVVGSTPNLVSYSGNRYCVIPGQESGASTNAPSGTTANNTWWLYQGAGGVSTGNNINTWVSGTTYRAGGAFHTDDGNATNLISGLYVEGGQGLMQCIYPTTIVGGQGTRNNIGTGIVFGYPSGIGIQGSLTASGALVASGIQHTVGPQSVVSDNILVLTTTNSRVDITGQLWSAFNPVHDIGQISFIEGFGNFYDVSNASWAHYWRLNGSNWFTVGPTGAGYYGGSGVGGTITQATSRTTGVTINKPTGQITLFSAAGSATWNSFTVTNSCVANTDTIIVCQKSGTDLYQTHVTNVSTGSFKISFATTGGTTTEQPVFNFAIIKGANN